MERAAGSTPALWTQSANLVFLNVEMGVADFHIFAQLVLLRFVREARDWHVSGGVFWDQEAHRCEMHQTRSSATSSTGLCGPLVGFYGTRKLSVKVVVYACKCTNIL